MNRAWEIISIHAPAWGATEIKAGRILQQEFQSTHPHGVRPHPGGVRLELPVFQSTHPHGVRPGAVSATNTPVSNFNPRTRMGCDYSSTNSRPLTRQFQSTHPHGVRLHFQSLPVSVQLISIHAPAWGATYHIDYLLSTLFYFNPRTRMGCDTKYATVTGSSWDFNPRTRMGCDHTLQRPWYVRMDFNPRTRMGCDLMPRLAATAKSHFNPRTRMGCDISPAVSKASEVVFQSTHPHGVRPILSCLSYHQ